MVGVVLCNFITDFLVWFMHKWCNANDDPDSVDIKDDADSIDISWLATGTRSMKKFNLVFKICDKGKENGIDTKGWRGWWPKQITTVGIDSRGGGEDGVGSRAREEKGRVTVNFLTTRVTFREIMLSGLGALIGSPSLMAILNGLGQLSATCL